MIAPLTNATWGAWYWPVALIAVTVIIMGPEIYALITNVFNTLSWWVWRTDIKGTARWYLSLGAWITVTSWLTYHFWFRKYT